MKNIIATFNIYWDGERAVWDQPLEACGNDNMVTNASMIQRVLIQPVTISMITVRRFQVNHSGFLSSSKSHHDLLDEDRVCYKYIKKWNNGNSSILGYRENFFTESWPPYTNCTPASIHLHFLHSDFKNLNTPLMVFSTLKQWQQMRHKLIQ